MNHKTLFSLSTLLLIVTACSKDAVKIPKEVLLYVDEISSAVDIHSDKQNEFLSSTDKMSYIDSRIDFIGSESVSSPIPVSFTWEEVNDLNQKASKYVLSISESINMEDSLEYTTKNCRFDVYNLKINTRYYYQIKSIHSGKSFLSSIPEFSIDTSAPRNIYVDGV